MEESSQNGSSSSGMLSGKFRNSSNNDSDLNDQREGNRAGGTQIEGRGTLPMFAEENKDLKLSN